MRRPLSEANLAPSAGAGGYPRNPISPCPGTPRSSSPAILPWSQTRTGGRFRLWPLWQRQKAPMPRT